jgi:hypothetical protein
MIALPVFRPRAAAFLTTVGAEGPHAVPVSAPVRADDRTILLSLHLFRDSLARLRARPQVALLVLAEEDVAFTARGTARIVAEPMPGAPDYAAVEITVTAIDDHRQTAGPTESGADRERGRPRAGPTGIGSTKTRGRHSSAASAPSGNWPPPASAAGWRRPARRTPRITRLTQITRSKRTTASRRTTRIPGPRMADGDEPARPGHRVSGASGRP